MGGRTTFGPFTLDREGKRLMRNGETVPVGHRGYVLLETLLDAAGEPVSKEGLMERAWPGMEIEEGNLTVQISTLRRQLGDGADAVIVTVPRVGYRLVAQPDRTEPDRGGPPLIAVLPFANRGSVADDGYFADGVVDDIVTALSRFKTFAVLSRGSTFALREKGIADARTAARELGIRYALEGSIRRMGDQLRVTAQLLDATTGAHLWAERYDGAAADVFSFQDKITESVVGVVGPEIQRAEIDRARRKPAASLDAYDLFLKAVPMVYVPGPERHVEAIELLSRATELDPGFALAHAYHAWVYEKGLSLRAPPLGSRDAATCIALARRALTLGGDDPLVRGICGWLLFRVAKEVSALEGLRAAVRENPNNVTILPLAGAGAMLHGCQEEAIGYYARAYALSPGSQEAYRSLQGIGSAHLLLGNYEQSIEWSLKSLATFNDLVYTYVNLACSYAMLDRMDEARATIRRLREIHPTLTVKAIEDGADEEDQYGLGVVPGLRKAGLPER